MKTVFIRTKSGGIIEEARPDAEAEKLREAVQSNRYPWLTVSLSGGGVIDLLVSEVESIAIVAAPSPDRSVTEEIAPLSPTIHNHVEIPVRRGIQMSDMQRVGHYGN